ncbi:MAG: DUF6034 family protein [Christensenella sp.]|nr:DUF6034 family protein [Christensenella sp.]
MKRRKFAFLQAVGMASALLLSTGCAGGDTRAVPSPVQLDTAQMMQTAASETPERNTATLREQLQAPESYQFEEQNGILSLVIDANVLVPDADSVSIVKTTGVDFTQEQVDAILALLWQEDAMWDNNPPLTKAQIAEQIASIEQNLETLPDYQDERTYYETVRLPELREKMKTAPETVAPVLSNGTLSVEQILDGQTEKVVASVMQLSIHGDSGRYFSVRNNPDNSTVLENTRYGRLDVRKWAMLDYQSKPDGPRYDSVMTTFSGMKVSPDDEAIPTTSKNLQQSPAQAAAMARDFFASLGEDIAIHDVFLFEDDAQSVYLIRCVRNVQGIPCILSDGGSTSLYTQSGDEELPDAVWANETITLVVDADGISRFTWRSPHRLGEPVVEDCKLLPFPKIMDVCTNLLPLLFREKWGHITDMTSASIRINRIEFGMTRIIQNQSIGEGLMIPVWVFYGSEPFVSASLGAQNQPKQEPLPLLTINAIDGTVVD